MAIQKSDIMDENGIGLGLKKYLKKELTIDNFQKDAQEIYDQLLSILVMKQIDYGPLNIWNAPGGATNGLMVRMSDKLERLKNLIYNSIEPNNEALEDSFIDIANYAIIALMVERGIWEKYATQQK